ncbi:MAG: ZIP family metal transporter, partial [Pirellulales bacterium]
MSIPWLLGLYCLLILLVSLAGGLVPLLMKITHRWMEFMLSFVAGVMLGVGILHLLPHALIERPPTLGIGAVMLCLLAGIMLMFLVGRFSCYHHHDVPSDGDLPGAGSADDATPSDHATDGDLAHADHAQSHSAQAACAHGEHAHDVTWSGAALGLTLHSVLAGIALAASAVADSSHGDHSPALAGFGTFLVIFLHKPFDSMTVTAL